MEEVKEDNSFGRQALLPVLCSLSLFLCLSLSPPPPLLTKLLFAGNYPGNLSSGLFQRYIWRYSGDTIVLGIERASFMQGMFLNLCTSLRAPNFCCCGIFLFFTWGVQCSNDFGSTWEIICDVWKLNQSQPYAGQIPYFLFHLHIYI